MRFGTCNLFNIRISVNQSTSQIFYLFTTLENCFIRTQSKVKIPYTVPSVQCTVDVEFIKRKYVQ